jgi:hypothetical protein
MPGFVNASKLGVPDLFWLLDFWGLGKYTLL